MDWAVVRTHPGAESRALKHLDRQEFVHFFPQYQTVGVRRGRRVDLAPYVFPTYGFVDMETGSGRALRGTRGVAEVLEPEGPVSSLEINSFVNRLMASRDPAGFIVMPQAAVHVRRIGDRVRVDRGPLEGRSGLYDGQTSQQRVFVLMRMMGRGAVRVRVNEADLAA